MVYSIYEFLNISDCLITDYSSVFFDYAITGRKIIIFDYDKKEYLKKKANAPVVPIINKTDFSSIDVNICDIEEQKNIVVKLNKINELIKNGYIIYYVNLY